MTKADDTDLATKVTGKDMVGVSSGLTGTDLATKVTGKEMAGVSSGLTANPAVKPTSKAP